MRTKWARQGRSAHNGLGPGPGRARRPLPGALLASTIGWATMSALLLGFTAAPVHAQSWPEAPPPPELSEDAPPPVLDERARQLQMLEEADITLIERPDGVVREYRIAGRLFMVEVVPFVGPRYYLIDTTGDGMLDSRRGRLGDDFVPPQWILFQW